MGILDIAAVLVTLAALSSFINHRFIRLPTTIGLMVIALIGSLLLIVAHELGFAFPQQVATRLVRNVNFDTTLLHGMLSFLLFAGALHVNLDDLSKQKWVVTILASVGVVTSTFLIGGLSWWVFDILGLKIDLVYCLLFGALISPTDPIAVLGILKSVGAPKSLAAKITGESLFNDGVGVVIFLALLGIATSGELEVSEVLSLFAEEAVGGVLFGLTIGAIAFYMLSKVDNYQVEVLITLALVMGGYDLARFIHVSGPIAIVVAGLLIGNHGRYFAMSDHTREHLDTFWELIDEILNAVLFVLIGLEVLVLTFQLEFLVAAALIIPAVLIARFITVGVPITFMRRFRSFSPNTVKVLTWGGLRGGISVALALALPAGEERVVLLSVTYIVVVFSIIVQGLTIGRVLKMS